MRLTHARLFATPDGESHFEDVSTDLLPTDFAPPAPPLDLSASRQATGFRFMSGAPGWIGEPHPSPRRQLFVGLTGEIEATASDGSVRSFRAGQVLLMEDTFGKGHSSRVVGEAPMVGVVVSLD